MPKKMFKCVSCGEYTLNSKKCPKCGATVKTPHPPKFSPHDKYQEYRLEFFKKKYQFSN